MKKKEFLSILEKNGITLDEHDSFKVTVPSIFRLDDQLGHPTWRVRLLPRSIVLESPASYLKDKWSRPYREASHHLCHLENKGSLIGILFGAPNLAKSNETHYRPIGWVIDLLKKEARMAGYINF
jgi:hypothetical protein